MGQQLLTMSFAAVLPKLQLVITDLMVLLFLNIFLDDVSVDANTAHQHGWFANGVGPPPPRPTTDNVSGFVID